MASLLQVAKALGAETIKGGVAEEATTSGAQGRSIAVFLVAHCSPK